MSWSIVTSTDVDLAVNRTTVPTISSALPSGVSDDEAGVVDGTASVGVGKGALGSDGSAVERGVDVDVDAQAATKRATRISRIT